MARLPERIEGEGLLLRRWESDDAEVLANAVTESAEHLRPWMPWMAAEPLSLQARRGLLSRWQREWEAGGDSVLGAFVDGAVAGSFGLHRRRGPETLEIGYWVHVAYLRRGLATRAAGLLSEAGLAVPGITRVEIHHDKANIASAGVPRKLGYRFIGETTDMPDAPGEVGVDCAWRLERTGTTPASARGNFSGMEILVVEDEAAIADFLVKGLEAEGFGVTVAVDGLAGEELALEPDVDLVVLDRMLPGRDGGEVLSAIRRVRPTLPVIFLTAKAEIADRVEGLDLGATDYVTKPFAFEELLARIRARLRDSGGGSETALEAAGIRLDLLTRRATRGELAIRLPEREAQLLAYLMRHPGRVCSREEILSAVWRYDHDPGTNVVQVYIGYLRRKLALPGSPAPIETVRSAGYRLRDEG